MNVYQTRYLDHQKRKAQELALISRRSHRDFARDPVPEDVIGQVYQIAGEAPSSCDRKAVRMEGYTNRDSKQLLSGLLVGGVGWCHRADTILLLFAHKPAYVAGDEIKFMPYLDAGVKAAYVLMACESLGLAACFINPNIRERHRPYFEAEFGMTDFIFCGAVALGYPYEDK